MLNRSFFSFLLLLLIVENGSLQATDHTTVLKGRHTDYAGDTITFLTYSNMLSFSEEEICSCAVDDSGYFKCRIDLTAVRHVFTYLGVYNCYLYAEPGMVYDIRLPRKREKSLQNLVDPLFEETAIHLSVKAENRSSGIPPYQDGELNFTIRAFNDSFYPYYYKFVISAYGNRVDRKELNKAVQEIREPFDSIPGSYLNTYIDYRIGLLEHYGSQVSNKRIIEEYFLGKPVRHLNPAYMELFNEVFKDYLISFAEAYPAAGLPRVVNRDVDYLKANEILEKEASLRNDSLREMVLLKGCYDGFYDGKNIPSSMIQMLDSLKSRTGNEFLQAAVRDIMLEITKILPGYEPPDFALYTSDSTLVRLSDYQGEYVYLNFCNSFGYYCVREFEYLRILHQRLKDKLSIVTILVDESIDNMSELVKGNNYPWTFLHFSNQPDVLEGYDIRTYPAYFLVGPEGKLILSPAPSPVENFESTFLVIYSKE
jgi:hypothetical protein